MAHSGVVAGPTQAALLEYADHPGLGLGPAQEQHEPPTGQKLEELFAAVLAAVLAVAGADGECCGRRRQGDGALLWGQGGLSPGWPPQARRGACVGPAA